MTNKNDKYAEKIHMKEYEYLSSRNDPILAFVKKIHPQWTNEIVRKW